MYLLNLMKLKSQILKTPIINKERFIVLDDIELFNLNSLNALLKIIEEPTINNFFILINNQAKLLIETVYSRSLEFKISLSHSKRIHIIDTLIEQNNLKPVIEYKNLNLSPGNFLFFNEIMEKNKINFEDDFISNIEKILNIYKKNKDINLINLALLFTDLYFFRLKEKFKILIRLLKISLL